MRPASTQYYLPDTLARWPYQRRLNPHYQAVKADASAWLEGFNALNSEAQDAFNRCDFNLFAALAYPDANQERLRTCCDLMNLFFLYDEYSDREPVEGMERLSEEIMYALRNPHLPRADGKYVVGEIFRQFWERAIKTGNPVAHQRFVAAFDEHTKAMIEEAHDRSQQLVRDLDGYLQVRRGTIGAQPAFTILEFDLDLPAKVLENAVVKKLILAATDMLSIANDIYSYNVEQARGDDTQNIVTIVMHAEGLDLHGALEWVKTFHDSIVDRFLVLITELPTWGEAIDRQLATYVQALGNWVRSNDSWCFESQRYFGKEGKIIQELRTVALLPKQQNN
ncbi:terpenoid synthase [Panus rudis PR-1116 ss-1]|nr:terpenoid synthase [Panus rudis PR-1116 ss-1]